MAETDFDVDAFDATVDENTDDSNGGGYEQSETEEKYDDASNTNLRPTVVVDAEAIELFDFNGDWSAEENLYKPNASEGDYPSQFILGLKGAEVQYGDIYEATNGHSADFKVLDTAAADVELDQIDVDTLPSSVDVDDMDDEDLINGVTIADRQFKSQKADELPDAIKVWQGGRAGEFLARFLDVIGGGSAYVPEADMGDAQNRTEGNSLFEYNPNDDGEPELRVARTPTLRSDMEGEAVRFYYKFGDGQSHQVRVQRIPEVGAPEDAGTTLNPQYQGDTDNQPEMTSYAFWDDNLGDAEASEDTREDGTDTDTDADTDDTETEDVDNPFADGGDEPQTYEELTEGDQAYVDDMIAMWADSPVSDYGDIRGAITFAETYAEHVEEGEVSGDVEMDTMAEIINTEA